MEIVNVARMGWGLILLVLVALAGCIGDVEVSCKVGGLQASTCTFTNKGTFPGRSCVEVRLKKTKDGESNPLLNPGGVNAPVGSISKSTAVCSGMVWGSSTTTVEIGYFDPNPMKMCGDWDNCQMEIVAAN